MSDHRFGWRPRLLVWWMVPAFVLPVLAGCAPPTASVSGKVLYKNKPVPGGIVTFFPVNAPTTRMSAFLDEEGRYELIVPVGTCKITVDNRELEAQASGGPANAPPPDLKLPPGVKLDTSAKPKARTGAGKYVPLPLRYLDPESTDQEYEVKNGPQTHDIVLNEGPTRRPGQ